MTTKALPHRCFSETLYWANAANLQENIFAKVLFQCNDATCSEVILDVLQICLTSLKFFFINIQFYVQTLADVRDCTMCRILFVCLFLFVLWCWFFCWFFELPYHKEEIFCEQFDPFCDFFLVFSPIFSRLCFLWWNFLKDNIFICLLIYTCITYRFVITVTLWNTCYTLK